jgi:hypothetical protein
MPISDAGELLRVLKDWKDAGAEFGPKSHPAVVPGSEAFALLKRLLRQQQSAPISKEQSKDWLPLTPEESLRRFQQAFERHGQSHVILLAHPQTDTDGFRYRQQIQEAGKPMIHAGMGTVQLADGQQYACVLTVMGDSSEAPIEKFIGLAKEAGTALLASPKVTFNSATDAHTLWLTFLFTMLRETGFVKVEPKSASILSPFAASVEAWKRLNATQTSSIPDSRTTVNVPTLQTVFYAWQSDLPAQTNRTFIEQAIVAANKRVRREGILLDPRPDQDARGCPGAADLPAEILDKIDRCSVFVGDVSIINGPLSLSLPPETFENPAWRFTPNPNALGELFYAAKRLGWDKVIPVINLAYAPIEQLPFDIRHRKILTYELAPGEHPAKAKEKLVGQLTGWLRASLKDIEEYKGVGSYFGV